MGRHVPWVKTPQDVITLLDTYMVQYSARELAYWQDWYDHGSPGQMAKLVALQMDLGITKPWVDFIFTRTFEYPNPIGGLRDFVETPHREVIVLSGADVMAAMEQLLDLFLRRVDISGIARLNKHHIHDA